MSKRRGWVWTSRVRDRLALREPCAHCGTPPSGSVPLEVDHILPRHLGGSDHPDNLQVLCRVCHLAKTSRARKRASEGARGYRG